MRQKRRIDFAESWFDWQSPEVPDKSEGDLSMGKS